MSRIFIYIYEWFERHRVTFYVVLVAMVALCAAMASQMSFQENITNFFGSDNDKKSASFANVAVKDKIVVMINGNDADAMIASAERFEAEIEAMVESGLISSVTAYADEDTISACTDFVYDHLPIFLTDEELYSVICSHINKEYSVKTPSQLGAQQKIDTARHMHFGYNATNQQLRRMLRMDLSILEELFP